MAFKAISNKNSLDILLYSLYKKLYKPSFAFTADSKSSKVL